MISAKFTKKDEAVFISHIDLIRAMTHILRRADIRPNYSKGFNPHMLIKFNAPMPLGLASCAEYFSLDIDNIPKEEFKERFNNSTVKGIEILEVFETKINPNFAGKIIQSEYSVRANFAIPHALENLNKSDYTIEYEKKGLRISEEVSAKIANIKVKDNNLCLRLLSGNENLRADRLIDNINHHFDLRFSSFDIERKAQFIDYENKIINVDDYLRGLCG